MQEQLVEVVTPRSFKGKAPAQEIRSHQLRLSLDEPLHSRGLVLREKGYYAGKYSGYFWAYILWVGLNQYERVGLLSSFEIPAEEIRTVDMKINIEDELYERGVSLRASGPLIGKMKGVFWIYVLWLGLEQYEKEILTKEV